MTVGTLSHPVSDAHPHSGTEAGLGVCQRFVSDPSSPRAQPTAATPPEAGALRPARTAPDTGDEGFQVPGVASLQREKL